MLSCLLWSASAVRAQPAFAPDSRAWDGLSDLRDLVEAQGHPVATPARLDLWTIAAQDAVIIVHPTRPAPASALARFMREGGRVALLDDYGQGQAVLRAFRIGRHAGIRPDPAHRLRGNPNLALATPAGSHPLTAGVDALVLNHAQVLHHDALLPVLTIDGGDSPVALTGAVGAGRLVAVSDGSVLINNMLQFRGNRRFAENLVAYLLGDRGGTLHLVSGDTEIRAKPGLGDPKNPLAAIREGLARISRLRLPKQAVWLSAWAVALASLLAAATALPRRARPARPVATGAGLVPGGYAGRIAFFTRPGANLFGAVLRYKHEFESALVRALGLHLRAQPSRADVLEALRARTGDAALCAEAESLLVTLDALALQRDRRPAPPRVAATQFTDMVEGGSRVLDALDALEPKDT